MSATGSRSREQGFTLIELMLVLVIVGLTSAAVLFAMPDPRGTLRDEAVRFATRVRAAQDGAILSGRPTALTVTPSGYRFEDRAEGRWAAPPDRALAARTWGSGISARNDGEGRAVFDPTGAVDPLALTLVRDGERVEVRVDGDGSVHVG